MVAKILPRHEHSRALTQYLDPRDPSLEAKDARRFKEQRTTNQTVFSAIEAIKKAFVEGKLDFVKLVKIFSSNGVDLPTGWPGKKEKLANVSRLLEGMRTIKPQKARSISQEIISLLKGHSQADGLTLEAIHSA